VNQPGREPRGPWWLWSDRPPQTRFGHEPERGGYWRNAGIRFAAMLSGALVGFVFGVLIGAVVPNSILAPGVAPFVCLIIGGIGFTIIVARTVK